ncbi:MAG: 1-acyl-sn-glycerol-3-phosphate acyltransferase [Bosea sp.]|jgi:1-acyl-sn-glycerol-3-phosphate acyltransferase|nr:1-acyl-sn-glycerol-3-phosphate acyltransferase [Bosea sp. (in: a-proteobacteria)]
MIRLRSLVFNILFYVNIIAWMIVLLPTFLLPRMAFMRAARAWARSSLWLLRVICGTRFELRGAERMPQGGFLVACKHQSMWETFALFCVFDDPAFVTKRELQWVPMFGWYTIKARSIPVNRKGGASALLAMNARAAEEAAAGRQIVIFPEGTRTAAGAPPSYKYGIAHMYEQMGISCLPVGINSGLFWPRRKFLRYPGTIVVEICEPIAPGLKRDAFFALMKERIETSSNALLAEGRASRRR